MEEERELTVTERIMLETDDIYTGSPSAEQEISDAQLHVEPWNRTTIADGLWLQENAIAPFSARDILLANEIDKTNDKVDELAANITDGRELKNFASRIWSAGTWPGRTDYDVLPDGNAVPRNALFYIPRSDDYAALMMTQDNNTIMLEWAEQGFQYRKLNQESKETRQGNASGVNEPEFSVANQSSVSHNYPVRIYDTSYNPSEDRFDVLTSGGFKALAFDSEDFSAKIDDNGVHVGIKTYPSVWVLDKNEVDMSDETSNTHGYYHGTEYKLRSSYSTTVADHTSGNSNNSYSYSNLVLDYDNLVGGWNHGFGQASSSTLGSFSFGAFNVCKSNIQSFNYSYFMGELSASNLDCDILVGKNLDVSWTYESIVNAVNSKVNSTYYSTVLGHELVTSAGTYHCYVNGIGNELHDTSYYNIVAGIGNELHDTSYYNIVAGSGNQAYNSAKHAALLGDDNQIWNTADHAVVAGDDNQIWNTANHAVIAGDGNEIDNGASGAFINGHRNKLHNGANFIGIVGVGNECAYTVYDSIIAGDNNTLSYSTKYSFIAGTNNDVHGTIESSLLAGKNNEVRVNDGGSVYNSLILGESIKVANKNKIAVGEQLVTKGYGSMVMGDNNTSWKEYVINVGSNNYIYGSESCVVGSNNNVGSHNAVFGQNNEVNTTYAFVNGENNTVGVQYAAAFGLGLSASNTHQFNIGKYNVSYVDSILEIGYGGDAYNRKTIFRVDRYGNVFCTGTIYAAGDVSAHANVPGT